jgi:hypothetical protein
VLAGAAALLEAHRPSLVVEMEERHRPGTVAATTAFLHGFGYVGYFLRGQDVVPLGEFDLEADQLRFLDGGPVFSGMPAEYVNNFLFLAAGEAGTPQLTEARPIRNLTSGDGASTS